MSAAKISSTRILLLFLFMNIINYVDRQVVSGVLPLLKDHFTLTDTALGLLGTAFMITYTLTAIPFGAWSDRWKPHKVAAIGVAVWSLATVSSALAWSFASLFIFRALVGIGEAAYVSTASTILSNVYPENKRSGILGLFNLGMPIGGAIGVVLGGWIGAKFGWQWAFFLVGVPGLILAYLAWKLPLPKPVNAPTRPKFSLRELGVLMKNRAFFWSALGYAGISFAFGAIVLFVPTFFQRELGYELGTATMLAGALQVGAGLLGAPIGGYVADFWQKRDKRGRAYTLVLSMAASAILLWGGLLFHSLTLFFLSAFFMLWHVGVAASLIFDVTEPGVWNTANAFAMFMMHLLGDIPSPVIVGYISDKASLTTAFAVMPIAMLFASVCFWRASRHQSKESSKTPRLV
ncbi:spinster family MFS transporter [Tumebacillus permanentifrigoris]|uniref:Putative MFS family arabinose efflux permease n=1 Tax=Tumebacillus permanentifrigoris TaxID=378543 RepID=A0A316D561_9BACL|nr:MFS transporter [Tumebacillus permanentifrigoris]PWK07457.1 putative MFS family arabinose efflux permease [Tumebacillus permanentifrigoris]